MGAVVKKKHIIWLTSCQFCRTKGDVAQTLYTLRALSQAGLLVDVVFAPDNKLPPIHQQPIAGVTYHPHPNPIEAALCLWAMDHESAVVSRGIGLTKAMMGTIPRGNLFAYLYGRHWESPKDLLRRIDKYSEVLTQNQ